MTSVMNVDLTGKRIALIGGAGFIGHNLALTLHSLGADVHVFDGLQVNNLGAFSNVVNDPLKSLYLHLINERIDLMRNNNIPLHVLDARDYQTLSRSLSDLKPQVIVQLAAIAHANRANKDPSAHSTIASGRLKMLSTAPATRPSISSISHRPWCTETLRATW